MVNQADEWKTRALNAETRIAELETDLAHWRQAAIDLAGHLELVRATLAAVVHETTRGAA